MRRIAALVTALVLTLALAAPATAGSHQKVPVEGSFVANWHVWTLSLTEQGPHKCLLQLDADLAFDGDLVGTALGSYDVLVFASCEEAAASPPGVLKELFWYWGSAVLSRDLQRLRPRSRLGRVRLRAGRRDVRQGERTSPRPRDGGRWMTDAS